jgi:hypothetical protein
MSHCCFKPTKAKGKGHEGVRIADHGIKPAEPGADGDSKPQRREGVNASGRHSCATRIEVDRFGSRRYQN